MFEKNRDSNALAAISKALAANPPPPKPIVPKPVVQQQPSAPVVAPVAATAPVVEKKAKKEKKNKEKKSPKKEKKQKHVEHTIPEGTGHETAPNVAMEVDETPLPVPKEQPTLKPAAQPAPPPPTAAALFPTWYLSKVAECFGDEIEALQDADAPVHPKVLMQALASAAPLYSQIEQSAAVGGGGE